MGMPTKMRVPVPVKKDEFFISNQWEEKKAGFPSKKNRSQHTHIVDAEEHTCNEVGSDCCDCNRHDAVVESLFLHSIVSPEPVETSDTNTTCGETGVTLHYDVKIKL